MLRDAAGVHLKMASARKLFNEDVNKTFIEDLKSFVNGTLADALVRLHLKQFGMVIMKTVFAENVSLL